MKLLGNVLPSLNTLFLHSFCNHGTQEYQLTIFILSWENEKGIERLALGRIHELTTKSWDNKLLSYMQQTFSLDYIFKNLNFNFTDHVLYWWGVCSHNSVYRGIIWIFDDIFKYSKQSLISHYITYFLISHFMHHQLHNIGSVDMKFIKGYIIKSILRMYYQNSSICYRQFVC